MKMVHFNLVGTRYKTESGGRLEGKSKMLFFSKRQNCFEEKNTGFLYSCLGLAICKRGASFQALPRKFDFV